MRSASEPALPVVSRSTTTHVEPEQVFELEEVEPDVPLEPSLQPLPVEPAEEVSVLLFHTFG